MENMGFHESSVTDFRIEDGKVVIDLEDVSLKDSKIKVRVEIKSVDRLLIDNKPADTIRMPASDGEVLTLEVSGSSLHVLIEWNDFLRRESFTHGYDIKGEKVKIEMV